MNILFLSLLQVSSLEERSIYTDPLRQFVALGHYVRVVSPVTVGETRDVRLGTHSILHVKTAQIQKVSLVKKGISTLQIGPNIQKALEAHCADEHYDLIVMATPPITLAGLVSRLKKQHGARLYLLLKDIWPQGIADLGAISDKGLIYRFFRAQERKLYAAADRIGCMSPANVAYVQRHNPQLPPSKVELCPNSVEPLDRVVTAARRAALREKYGVPERKTVFLYGGNLGRPQGILFLIDCLQGCANVTDAFFVICGSGTEYPKLEAYLRKSQPAHVLLLPSLPREEYEDFVSACDVGLLLLDYRFTIPNFPSRLLSYLQAGLPVLSCTDSSTDIGEICAGGGFGWKCPSNDASAFRATVSAACTADRAAMGKRGCDYLKQHYTAEETCRIILTALEEDKHV